MAGSASGTLPRASDLSCLLGVDDGAGPAKSLPGADAMLLALPLSGLGASIARAWLAGMAKPARHVRKTRFESPRARLCAWLMAKTLRQRAGAVKGNRTAGRS